MAVRGSGQLYNPVSLIEPFVDLPDGGDPPINDTYLDIEVRFGSTPRSLAATKNVSGAGFPASRCAWITFPSTRTSKRSSNLAALRTASQF